MQKSTESFLQRIKRGLSKTRNTIAGKIEKILPTDSDLDEKLENIEEALIESDLGVDLSMDALSELRSNLRSQKNIDGTIITRSLEDILKKRFLKRPCFLRESNSLVIIIFAGINGTGKTTSLAKIALHLLNSNKKVMLAACDTFRAAAIEQISLWGEKLGINVIKSSYGADAASVAFDAIDSAKAKNMDYLLIDTAGRFHSKKELMDELKKVIRICEKKVPSENIEKLFILDGTTGQNGFYQAKAFFDAIGLDGIVVTKLDGTAKGGIVVAIEDQLHTPIKFIGLGEEMEDLLPFDPDSFVKAILE